MNYSRCTVCMVICFLSAASFSRADGLIHKLPKDGSWVEYELTGSGLTPTGEVRMTTTGTVTVKSVGQEKVDGKSCRWIEMEIAMEAKTSRGLRSRRIDDYKLLIPEDDLAAGKDPLAHVSRLLKKDVRGFVTEHNLKDGAAEKLKGLATWISKPLGKSEQEKDVELKAPDGTYKCTRISGKQAGDSEGVEMDLETWVTDQVPFGVAAYQVKTQRKEGSNSFELKFVKTGTDAKSSVVPEEKKQK